MAQKKKVNSPSRKQGKQIRQNRQKQNYVLWGSILVLFILLGAAFVWLNGNGGEASVRALPLEISVTEASQMRDSGAFMLDVRTQEEWDEYHMPGATLIPLDQLASRLDEVPSDKDIVVVCRSGNRSATGRDILLDAGFESVTSMAGGMSEWRTDGYPVE